MNLQAVKSSRLSSQYLSRISQLHHVDHGHREHLVDLGSVSAHLQMDPVGQKGAFESNKRQFVCKETKAQKRVWLAPGNIFAARVTH